MAFSTRSSASHRKNFTARLWATRSISGCRRSMQERFDNAGYKLEDRGARWIEGYAFLKPGVTRQQAQAELNSISQRLENDFPETNRGQQNELVPLWKTPFNGAGNMSSTLAI